MAVIKLKKGSYESARVAVKRGSLFGSKQIKELSALSFEEILKYLEENGFKDSIDSSYLEFEGFYLIEKVINSHLSKTYTSIFAGATPQNKQLLETYYLKYQIHNILATLRCKESGEEDISPYLLGDDRRQEKFFKAYEMPVNDALVYMLKKIGINSDLGLEKFKNGGLFELENFLYSNYYEKLSTTKFVYNKIDETKFLKFIKSYVDLVNARSFVKLKIESNEKISFEDVYVEGGNLNKSFFDKLDSFDIKETIKELSKEIEGLDENNPSTLDKSLNDLKNSGKEVLKVASFGSPFYALKFLFEAEQEMSQLRTLLKAKYLKLSDEETQNLLL